MWLGLAVILFLVWVGCFLLFHIAGFALHILLVFAVISVIIHFISGRKAA